METLFLDDLKHAVALAFLYSHFVLLQITCETVGNIAYSLSRQKFDENIDTTLMSGSKNVISLV